MSFVVVAVGRLVKDPVVREAGSKEVGTFTLATNRSYQKDGEWVDLPATYLDVKAWDRLAESCKRLGKGQEVMVYGELEQETWKDKESGDNRSKLVLNAQRIKKVGGSKKSEGEDGGSGQKDDNETVPF